MGGQACVLYGAAEFSRDTDLAVLCDHQNLARLQCALDELEAKPIAVPPFEIDYLQRGHAVHFRCAHPEAAGLRVDVMSVMRGVEPFPLLWERRTTFETPNAELDLLSLPDLVKAKKTQRDKDWPMIRRLVEAHYFVNRADATTPQIDFWLRELRTSVLLCEVADVYRDQAEILRDQREVLDAILKNQTGENELLREEQHEREVDANYWRPLKSELEALRRRPKSYTQNPERE